MLVDENQRRLLFSDRLDFDEEEFPIHLSDESRTRQSSFRDLLSIVAQVRIRYAGDGRIVEE